MKFLTALCLFICFLCSTNIQAETKIKRPTNNQISPTVKQIPINANEGLLEKCIDFSSLVDSETHQKGEIYESGLFYPTFRSHKAQTIDGHVTFETLYSLKKLGSNLGLIKGVPNSTDIALVAYRYDKVVASQPQVIRIELDPPVQRAKILAGRAQGRESSVEGIEQSNGSNLSVEGRIEFKSLDNKLIGDAESLYDIKVHGLKKIEWIERRASSANPISTIYVNAGGGGSAFAGNALIWGLCFSK
jgi:hypothetical protein